MKAISIQNLTKTYANGTRALKGINLEVSDGDFFALLGANGAGKTTIIGILTDLIRKTSGSCRIFGLNLETQITQAKKMIGVVPQEFNFNMFENVQDILVSQAGYFGVERPAALKSSETLLKKLELWEKRNVPSRTLSGGMKRRLMIARALVHQPRLLILDEPTAGVDVELRHDMWRYLRELNTQGTTILLTTHYLEEVEQMCRHAAIIKNGEIIKNDRVRNLLQLLEQETYVISVREMKSLDGLKGFNPVAVDDTTLEVDLEKKQTLNDLISRLDREQFLVTDLRPKGNRMERLYLNILKQS